MLVPLGRLVSMWSWYPVRPWRATPRHRPPLSRRNREQSPRSERSQQLRLKAAVRPRRIPWSMLPLRMWRQRCPNPAHLPKSIPRSHRCRKRQLRESDQRPDLRSLLVLHLVMPCRQRIHRHLARRVSGLTPRRHRTLALRRRLPRARCQDGPLRRHRWQVRSRHRKSFPVRRHHLGDCRAVMVVVAWMPGISTGQGE